MEELDNKDKEILKNLKDYLNLLISKDNHKIIYNELGYDEKIIDCINVLEKIIEDNIYLTFEKLSNIIEKYNIPKNVHLMSDSGWECGETEMNGILYNEKENIIVFKENIDYLEEYYKNWKIFKIEVKKMDKFLKEKIIELMKRKLFYYDKSSNETIMTFIKEYRDNWGYFCEDKIYINIDNKTVICESDYDAMEIDTEILLLLNQIFEIFNL